MSELQWPMGGKEAMYSDSGCRDRQEPAGELISDPAGLALFTDADACYDDMLAAIGEARARVWMETYIFSADRVGWLFAEALAERARAGVDVRLRVDSAGALATPYSKRIRRYLHDAGVDLRWFNRLRRLLPAQLNHRDHRKLLIVDRRYLYVGSSNIMWSNSRRLCGERCTRQLDVRLDGDPFPDVMQFAMALWQGRTDVKTGWRPVADGESRFVASSPHDDTRPLRTLYRALFEQAERSVWLAVAYFIPDKGMVRSIEDAARRGVDVRLLLPGAALKSPTRWAAHAFYQRLLDAGARVYEYQPAILHTKAAVVDSTWAVLGSGNYDYRSFFLNYELSLETRDADFCRQLQQALRRDLAHSQEITRAAWAQRPWTARMRESLIWPTRRLL